MELFILAYYIIIFLFGLPANILALYAFSCKIHTKASPTDVLLLNLTVSDLLFLLCLPLKMYEVASGMHWLLPQTLCLLSTFVFYTTIHNSSILLTATSVDRYLCVGYAVWYRQHVRAMHGVLASVFIWILSSAHFIYLYLIELMPDSSSPSSGVCYDNFTEAQLGVIQPIRLELCVVFFILPLLVSSFCYVRFILILSRISRLQPEKRRRAAGMAVGTLLVFVVCFMPYNITHILGYIQGGSVGWRTEALLLTATNAILDPIIFYFSSSTFQGSTRKVICLMWSNGCCKTKCTSPPVEAATAGGGATA
ncbi:free fatty acid receptor 3-like [Clupea harengus]|uniref:Free fatty acid receptor 3-like n=1 Tax=Clupea harengus TaxID=7950 RepID=A0A6P3W064_CLUHA|nr:free fatty acid receptor 3-like [Clupea harengus]